MKGKLFETAGGLKELLVEVMLVQPQSTLVESAGQRGYVILEHTDRVLRVRLPATTLDVKNENGRIYSTMIMEGACRKCTENCQARRLLSAVNDHPEGPFVSPGDASHIVTRVWVEGKYLWNEWDILDTSNGKNLRALVEGNAAFGVSIRGLGSTDDFGNILEDYEYLGTDCVGNPSSKIWATPETVGTAKQENKEAVIEEPVAISESMTTGVKDRQMNPDVKKYLAEQVVLLQAEKEFTGAYQRMTQVEEALGKYAESKIPASLITEVFSSWDKAKTEAIERLKSPGNEQLESLKKQMLLSAQRQAKIVTRYRTEQVKLANEIVKGKVAYNKVRIEYGKFRSAAIKELTTTRKKLRTYAETIQETARQAAVAVKLTAMYKAKSEAVKTATSTLTKVVESVKPVAQAATKKAPVRSIKPNGSIPVTESVERGKGEASLPEGWL